MALKLIPLSPSDVTLLGYTHKIDVAAADIIGLTKATAYPLYPVNSGSATFPAGLVVKRVDLKVNTAAASAGTVTCSVGNSGSGTKYHNGVSVKTTGLTSASANVESAASQLTFQFGTDQTDLTGVTNLAMEIFLHLTPTGDLDGVSAGL